MHKCLHLICPTDGLESTINNRFNYDNYFYTSLGNSVVFDDNTVCQIKSLIKKHDIKEVSFVLSSENSIVFDALGNQNFSDIRGLNNFYLEINKQRVHSRELWRIDDNQYAILSYYLNNKINELQFELNNLHIKPIKISGKIYNKQEGIFDSIYSDLLCIKKYALN